MITVRGKYNSAVIYSDTVDQTSIRDITAMCNLEFLAQSKIRIMPDVHAGKGCTIGTTMTVIDKVVPNFVGVDIGCGMEVTKLAEKQIPLDKLDELIYKKIPAGQNVRADYHAYNDIIDLETLFCKKEVSLSRARLSIGSLGGGNHFIEVDKDEQGFLYLVIHSGSRHLGAEVCDWYQNEAYRRLCGNSQRDIDELIKKLKDEGRSKEIQKQVNHLKTIKSAPVPKEFAYCEGDLFAEYLSDMRLTQQFAVLNRQAMADEIIRGLGLTVIEQFTTVHNYINVQEKMLRKGAVSAKNGEKLLIPMNMRDGSLICIGKGNEEWNCSAPHGAGRLYSRATAKNELSMEEYQQSMQGIYTTSVNQYTLDECPQAYKPMDEIVANVGDTVQIISKITPIYNFKA